MVVDDVSQVVSRQVVGTFVEHLIVENIAHDAHFAANDVVHEHLFAGFHLKAYHILFAGINQALRFLVAQYERVAHIHTCTGIILKVLHRFAFSVQFFGRIESHVSLASLEQLVHIFAVNVATFALAVRTMFAAEAHALVEFHAEPFERFDDVIFAPGTKRFESVSSMRNTISPPC